MLPKPVASCRYWHRSIDPKKLIEVGITAAHARYIDQKSLIEAGVRLLRCCAPS